MSLNKVTLSGNLGADADLRYMGNGTAVCSFSLAVNDRMPKGDGEWGEWTNWPDCVIFGKRAEALAPWLCVVRAQVRTRRALSAGGCDVCLRAQEAA